MISLFLLAIAPGIAIALYIYRKDIYQHEPKGLLLKCFFAGILSIIPAALLESYGSSFGIDKTQDVVKTFIYAFFVVALVEEGLKYLLVYVLAYRNPHFDEPFDGIVYAVMVSMGFATFENVFYVFQHGLGTAIMRMFTAVPAHAIFAIMMGYFLGKAKFNPSKSLQYKVMALGSAVFFHGTYDYSLFETENYPLAVFGTIISLVIGLKLARKAIRISSDSSPFRITATHDESILITDHDVSIKQHDSVIVTNNPDDITDNDPNQ